MPKSKKPFKFKLSFRFFAILSVLVSLVIIFKLLILPQFTNPNPGCREHDEYLPMPAELVDAELILDSELLRQSHSWDSNAAFFQISKFDHPDFADFCSEASRESEGLILDNFIMNQFSGKVIERESFKIIALIRNECKDTFACIDVSQTNALVQLEDESGKKWLIDTLYLFNLKSKNNPEAAYYARLKTANGKEKLFIPEDYFTKEDGLLVSD